MSELESDPVPASDRVASAAREYVESVIDAEIDSVTWEIQRNPRGGNGGV